MIKMKIFTLIIIIFAFINSINAGNFKLSSSDKVEFPVDKEMIKSLSVLVKTSLEADEEATEVPIPGVSAHILNYLVGQDFEIDGEKAKGILGIIYKINPKGDKEKEAKVNKHLDEILNNISDTDLIDLINAVNYMDIRGHTTNDKHLLLNSLITMLAKRIVKDKSKKSLIDKFGSGLKALIEKKINNVQRIVNSKLHMAFIVSEDINQVKKRISNELEQGADINGWVDDSFSVLMWAIESRNVELINFLLTIPQLDLTKNLINWDTFIFASKFDEKLAQVLQKLFDAGLNVNARYKNNQTPLMIAIQNRKLNLIKFFLKQKGIDLNIKDNNGETALAIAKRLKKPIIIHLLKDAGAKE